MYKLNSGPPVFHCEAGGGCGNSGNATEFNSFFVQPPALLVQHSTSRILLLALLRLPFQSFVVWLLQNWPAVEIFRFPLTRLTMQHHAINAISSKINGSQNVNIALVGQRTLLHSGAAALLQYRISL